MTTSFRTELTDYILSGHSYLHVSTTEKTRLLSELKDLADNLPDGGRQIFTWNHAVGWQDGDGRAAGVQLVGGSSERARSVGGCSLTPVRALLERGDRAVELIGPPEGREDVPSAQACRGITGAELGFRELERLIEPESRQPRVTGPHSPRPAQGPKQREWMSGN